jgi:hypothetical protein
VEPRGLEPLTPCLQSRSGTAGDPHPRGSAHVSLVAQAVIIADAAAPCCCRNGSMLPLKPLWRSIGPTGRETPKRTRGWRH